MITTTYKRIYKLGFVAYAIMLLLAVFFYKERTVFVDIAYHLFHIIKDDALAIQNYRFGAVVTQIFPLLASRLGLSLNSIAIVYSLSFPLYYLVCYWVCGSVLKQHTIALCLLLMQTIFVTDTFYWIQSELPQGLAMLMVMTAMLTSTSFSKQHSIRLVFLLPVILLTISFHPILFIPALFLFLWFAINLNSVSGKKVLYTGFILFLLLFIIKQKLLVASYEADAMDSSKNLWRLFPNWINLTSNKAFLEKCSGNFIWIPVCTLLISIIQIQQRKWKNLFLFWSFTIAYLLLINTSYPHSAVDFYIENLYLPLGVFIAIALVYDVLPALRLKFAPYLFITTLLVSFSVRLFTNSDTYTNRLRWERDYLQQSSGEKSAIAETPQMRKVLLMSWGTPYEFWLLSTIETGQTASIIISENNINELEKARYKKTSFFTTWLEIEYQDLPEQYFKFTDTTSGYRIIK